MIIYLNLTTLGDRSFAVAAPQLWNSLPYVIRSNPSVASFKKTLKTFLFQKAFFIILLVSFNLVFLVGLYSFTFLSADENSFIDIGAIQVLLYYYYY